MLCEMAFGRNEKWGENKIGQNCKRAGQILDEMGKGRSWKWRKKNGRNGKDLDEMGMGEMGLDELGKNQRLCIMVL